MYTLLSIIALDLYVSTIKPKDELSPIEYVVMRNNSMSSLDLHYAIWLGSVVDIVYNDLDISIETYKVMVCEWNHMGRLK